MIASRLRLKEKLGGVLVVVLYCAFPCLRLSCSWTIFLACLPSCIQNIGVRDGTIWKLMIAECFLSHCLLWFHFGEVCSLNYENHYLKLRCHFFPLLKNLKICIKNFKINLATHRFQIFETTYSF